ncbi:unnamed protein product [Phytophthora fragariaefolia]|uniref:Unnamed protein product n=1 Tax=Phytophthora fragariaefolia TaxID=1490495 RepID=A0A9W7D1E0_9STRA|nr:unnamed protein product [Phytophthora fragariaefolia]
MRVTSVLVVTVTTILASGGMALSDTNKEVRVSQLASHKATAPIEAGEVMGSTKSLTKSLKSSSSIDGTIAKVLEMDPKQLVAVLAKAANANKFDTLLARAANAKAVDNFVAEMTLVDDVVLNEAVIAFARRDSDLTLLKMMYNEKVTTDKFATMLRYNPNSMDRQPNGDVYQMYNWYTLYHNAQPVAFDRNGESPSVPFTFDSNVDYSPPPSSTTLHSPAMQTSSLILTTVALLAVAALAVRGDETPITSHPEVHEKASWAPLRALAAMDEDQISTSQPVVDEKASWAPLRALRTTDDTKQ